MHRGDPTRVHRIVAPAQHLDLVVLHLQLAPIHRHHSGGGDLGALREPASCPRLVEEQDVEVPRPVGERDRHHRAAVAHLPLHDALHARDHGREGPDLQLPDRSDLGAIDVAAWVVVQQRPDGLDPVRPQHVVSGITLLPAAGAAVRDPGGDRGDRVGEGEGHWSFHDGRARGVEAGRIRRTEREHRSIPVLPCGYGTPPPARRADDDRRPDRSAPGGARDGMHGVPGAGGRPAAGGACGAERGDRPPAPHDDGRAARHRSGRVPDAARPAPGHARDRERLGVVVRPVPGRRPRAARGCRSLRRPDPVPRRRHPRRALLGGGVHRRDGLDLPQRVRPSRGRARQPGVHGSARDVVLRRAG